MCCAITALLTLVLDPTTSSRTVADVMPRCGNGCRGVGMGVQTVNGTSALIPTGCAGVVSMPNVAGGLCESTHQPLSSFQPNPSFGGASPTGVCHGPVCVAVYGSPLKIKSHKNKPIRVTALQSPDAPYPKLGIVVTFAKNHVPPRSHVIGPMAINCTDHSGRLKLGAGSVLENVLVNCPDTCPVHVMLKRNHKKAHTVITDVHLMRHVTHSDLLAEAKLCSTMITPVPNDDHPRDFVARGTVTVTSEYGHGITVANVNGILNVVNNGEQKMNVTVLDTLEDTHKRLTIFTSGTGHVHINNITALMDVFSQEYMVQFFGPAPRKENEMHTLKRLNWTLAGIILALWAGNPDLWSRVTLKDSEASLSAQKLGDLKP